MCARQLPFFKRSFILFTLLIINVSLNQVAAGDHVKTEKKIINSKTSGFIDEALTEDGFDEDSSMDEPDPLENLNRVVFGFNKVIDGLIFKPIATIYDTTIHSTGKTAVRNLIDNAFSPVEAINHTLQGEGAHAIKTIFRFVINTTIGLLGTMDAASGMGLPKEPTSLNETFATWGMGTGPYIVLPILGPSSLRDATGKLGEAYMDPLYYYVHNKHRGHNRHRQQMIYLKALYGFDAVDRRRQVLIGLRDLENTSSDFYVGMRSIFFQKQEAITKKIKERKAESQKREDKPT
ncbi:MAG: VacJ family lipoprotein [Candidatus Paracaedibacteraceae bacterium]|nr:VacJ family lipoprotein [Candidatus Paracaedibacteraceae bacterium]